MEILDSKGVSFIMANDKPIPEPERVSPSAETVPNIPLPPWPPVQQQFRRRETTPPGMLIFLGVLALILVVSGLGFIIFATTTQYQKNAHTQATRQQVPRSPRKVPLKPLVRQQRGAFGTANANIYASATATNGCKCDTDSRRQQCRGNRDSLHQHLHAGYQWHRHIHRPFER